MDLFTGTGKEKIRSPKERLPHHTPWRSRMNIDNAYKVFEVQRHITGVVPYLFETLENSELGNKNHPTGKGYTTFRRVVV